MRHNPSGRCLFLLGKTKRKVRVKVAEQLREIWRQATTGSLRRNGQGRRDSVFSVDAEAERKTLAMPAILSPIQFPGKLLPKPTPANLRRFAETPVVRRAINVIKDRIASMDWQVRVRRGVSPHEIDQRDEKLQALRRTLEEPNAVDTFRTLIEQVIEDALTGGFGAAEMEPTGDPKRPAMFWAVDGASIRMNARWDGQPETARYAQAAPGQLESAAVDLRDDQLMYVRMNPRSFTPFGLGPLEVAFETVNQFLTAHRFAGKLAANSVAQYALWLSEATPAARPADSMVAGRDRGDRASAPHFHRAEAGSASLRAGDGRRFTPGLAAVPDPDGCQRLWTASHAAWPGRRCESGHGGGVGR